MCRPPAITRAREGRMDLSYALSQMFGALPEAYQFGSELKLHQQTEAEKRQKEQEDRQARNDALRVSETRAGIFRGTPPGNPTRGQTITLPPWIAGGAT